MGKHRGDLYILDPANLFPISGVCNNVSKKEHEVWHSHLEHPSYVRLNVLKNVLHFKQLLNETPHCSICHLAKQKRLPFSNSNSCQFLLLNCCIWMFGVLSNQPMMGFVSSLLLWMILLVLLGCICWKLNLMLHAFFLHFIILSTHNMVLKSNQFVVIMYLN